MVQLGPYYSISEWWIHLAIFWNFSEGGCPKLEFLWALILQHVNQNKWLRFKTNHGSHFCSNWTKTKRKQKQSGDYIQGIYGRDCICTGNWFGHFMCNQMQGQKREMKRVRTANVEGWRNDTAKTCEWENQNKTVLMGLTPNLNKQSMHRWVHQF